MAGTLCWRRDGVSPELALALDALGEEYPVLKELREGEGAPSLVFTPGGAPGSVECSREGDEFRVRYGRLADALRGLSAALAGLPKEGKTISENCLFSTLGIMLDCSRNAVMRVDHLKLWMRRLALLGYNMVMLYTEDTYELPAEPLFGAFRGRYTPDELKELDAFAARLGIELVGCIQTLGHLAQVLKWGAYGPVKDTESVVLVDEPATERLIGKMIDAYAGLRSRRIHVGMDEAHDLGRGRFMDLHGHERGFDIFNRHLAKVVSMCSERGLRPMIWSDMYFRLGSKTGAYYDSESVIPDDVRRAIPADVDLVYWDYYHDDEGTYRDMIERHRALGHEPVVGSGVWTWGCLWYDRGRTESTVRPCIRACREAGLKEVFFTMWGDDGGCCEFDSALAGLAFAADEAYGGLPRRDAGTAGAEGCPVAARYEAVCGVGYDATLLGSRLTDPTLGGRSRAGFSAPGWTTGLLWDDPLLGLYWTAMKGKEQGFWEAARVYLEELAKELSPLVEGRGGETGPVDFDHALALARFLAAKAAFRLRLEAAYAIRDLKNMKAVGGDLIDEAARLAELTEELGRTFRRQWYRRNKPFGFEVIQIRLGGQRARFLEVSRRLEELIEGTLDTIPELDEGLGFPAEAGASFMRTQYRRLATSSGIL